MRDTPRPRHRLMVLCTLLLLAGCGRTPTPPARTPPVSSPTVSPVRTREVVVRRGTPGLPTRGPATPDLPQTTPREGAGLVVQVMTLLLTDGLAAERADILYDAAYGGAVAALGRLGYTVEGDSPRFTNLPVEDAERFTAAYLKLVGAPAVIVNQTGLAYEVIRAVTDRLDECNTYLLEPREYQTLLASADGAGDSYGGVGVSLRPGVGPATIAAVYPDTPAARLGLQPGDTIVAVDGALVATLSAEQVGTLLRGPAGAAVELTIARPGEAGGRVVVLTRGRIQPPTLTATIMPGADGRSIGQVRLRALTPGVEQELDRALTTFAEANVVGWLLDLREADGESVEALAAVGGRFLAAGQPVAYRVREGQEGVIGAAGGAAMTEQRPLAVLLNGGTRGMAEVLAAALADAGRARLFGEATAGCVSLSTLVPLANGAALHLGTAYLFSPTRRTLTSTGQQPNEVVWPRPTPGDDPQTAASLAWLASQGR